MAHKFAVTFEGDHVRSVSSGQKNIKHAAAIWAETVKVCIDCDCYVVLCIFDSRKSLHTIDAFDHAELFGELGIDDHYQIAWVEKNPAAIEATRFVARVLSNRGLPGRVFNSEEEARAWLFE